MKTQFLKTLWMLRFQKMKKNEEEAAWKYQEILDRFLTDAAKEDSAVEPLRQLVQEERMHARLAEELIRIVYQNHPECEILTP